MGNVFVRKNKITSRFLTKFVKISPLRKLGFDGSKRLDILELSRRVIAFKR